MGKGAIWIGMVFIVFGIWLGFKILSSDVANTELIWVLIYPLFSIGIGIALIIFYKEEGKIEQRKDLKEKKSKK